MTCDRASRLSGEPRSRNYVKSGVGAGNPGYVYDPGQNPRWKPTPKPKFPNKRNPNRPLRPHKYTKPAPLPFKPLKHGGQSPFGKRLPPLGPLPGGLGGLTAKGRGLLRKLAPLPLSLVFTAFEYTSQQPDGNLTPYDFKGWTPICNVPPNGGYIRLPSVPYSGPDTRLTYGTAANPGLPCTTVGQVAQDNLTNGAGSIPANQRWASIGPDSQGGVIRMQLRAQWTRGASQPALPPLWTYPRGQGQPMRLPAHPFQSIDPFELPLLQPIAHPRPIPFRLIPERRSNPDRSPLEQPGGAQPSAKPQPYHPPYYAGGIPSKDIVIGPGPSSPAGPRPDGGRPPRTPPNKPVPASPWSRGVHKPENHGSRGRKRGKKPEKKLITSIGSKSLIGLLVGLTTESLDLLNAFYKSLPYKYQLKGGTPTPQDKFLAVWSNLDKVPIGTLVANITAELIEDTGYGKLGKQVAEANKKLGIHFERGPGDQLGNQAERPDGYEPIQEFNDWLEDQYNAYAN